MKRSLSSKEAREYVKVAMQIKRGKEKKAYSIIFQLEESIKGID